jgi:hypothetical protein
VQDRAQLGHGSRISRVANAGLPQCKRRPLVELRVGAAGARTHEDLESIDIWILMPGGLSFRRVRGIRSERDPPLGGVEIHPAESGRSDTDDRIRFATQHQLLPHDVAIPLEFSLPEAIADDDDRRSRRQLLLVRSVDPA